MPIQFKTQDPSTVQNAKDSNHLNVFIDSNDGLMKNKDSSGTVTTVGSGGGAANPLTEDLDVNSNDLLNVSTINSGSVETPLTITAGSGLDIQTSGSNIVIGGMDCSITMSGSVTVIGGSVNIQSSSSPVMIQNLYYPNADGSSGQAIITDGAGNLSFGQPVITGIYNALTISSGSNTTTFDSEQVNIAVGDTPCFFNVSANGTNRITVNATTGLMLNNLIFPTADGSNGQALITDGAGVLSWNTVSGSGLSNPLTADLITAGYALRTEDLSDSATNTDSLTIRTGNQTNNIDGGYTGNITIGTGDAAGPGMSSGNLILQTGAGANPSYISLDNVWFLRKGVDSGSITAQVSQVTIKGMDSQIDPCGDITIKGGENPYATTVGGDVILMGGAGSTSGSVLIKRADETLAIDGHVSNLYRYDGTTPTVLWHDCYLYDTSGQSSIDWGTSRIMVDSSSATSVDWQNRYLKDSSSVLSVDWNARKLYQSDGTTVALDWSSTTVGGSGSEPETKLVRVVTSGNVDLSTDLENGDTVREVTLVTGDRVLVASQTTASENGIYVVSAGGAASRASDADTAEKLHNCRVLVTEHINQTGYLATKKFFFNTNIALPTLGVDDITFAEEAFQRTNNESGFGEDRVRSVFFDITEGGSEDQLLCKRDFVISAAHAIDADGHSITIGGDTPTGTGDYNGGDIILLPGGGLDNGLPGKLVIGTGCTIDSRNGGNTTLRTTDNVDNSFAITCGNTSSNGGGNCMTLTAGDGGSTSGDGGYVSINAGNGGASGHGGNIEILAGDGVGTNKNGGAINIQPGAKTGAGVDGVLSLGWDADCIVRIAHADASIGLFGATPIAQGAAIADATDAASVITQLNLLLAHLRLRGDIAT